MAGLNTRSYRSATFTNEHSGRCDAGPGGVGAGCRRMRRLLIGVVVSTVAVALLGACSGSGGRTATAVRSSTTSPLATASTSVAPSTSTVPKPAASGCGLSELTVSAGPMGAGLGHAGLPILFNNSGTRTCTLSGYPGIAALDAGGNQVAQAQRTPNGYLGGLPSDSTPLPVVELPAGQTASALVEGTNNPVGTAASCPTYPQILVTPPNETHSVTLGGGLRGCSQLQIHPVVPGTTGSLR